MLVALFLLLQTSPEESLRKLEERLLKAKTFQLSFKAEGTFQLGRQKDTQKIESTLHVKGPARFRFVQKMVVEEAPVTVTIVSDGTKVVARSGDDRETHVPMQDSGERLAILFARLGLMSSVWLSMANEDRDPFDDKHEYIPDLRRLAKYSDYGAEDGLLRYVITYRKRNEEADSTAKVTVRFDKDGLPTTRRGEHLSGARRVVVEEIYEGWKLDEEIADDVFNVDR